jgi:energy-coupling factor transporter transmembrane protein EcfT
MAELTSFAFHPGKTVFHCLDVRFKLVAYCLSSLFVLMAETGFLTILILLVLMIILRLGISVSGLIKQLRYFFVLLLFVFLARTFTAPGETFFSLFGLQAGKTGVCEGLRICLRLVFIVLLSLVFVSTTRNSHIRAAIRWLFTPVPFIPEERVAIMIGLMIRFIPVILHEASEIGEAQKSRGMNRRKNPVYRMVRFSIPLIRKTFQSADELVMAMVARGYTGKQTPPEFHFGKPEKTAAIVWLTVFLLIFTFQFI